MVKRDDIGLLLCIGLFFIGITLKKYNIGFNLFYYKHAFAATLFVYSGYVLRKRQALYRKITGSNFFLIIYLILCLGEYLIDKTISPLDAGMNITFKNAPFVILYSLIGTFALIRISMIINHSSFLEYYGRNTLLVFCFHIIPYTLIAYALKQFFIPTNLLTGLVFFILVYSIEILVMILFIKLFNLYPF